MAALLINLMTLSVYSQASGHEQNQQSLSKQKALTESISLNSSEAMQGITITGRITDSNGEPLPGVNVLEKGTSNGTITDVDGNYSIIVLNGESELSFSFVGYITEDIPVGDQTNISLTMVEDLIGLSEVVVVGYGSVKKSDVTGALSSVSAEQLQEMPTTNVNQALQGRAAGVDISTRSFGLNAKPVVRIRGNRSISAKNDPLYVVDGIPLTGDINDLNSGDIESVEVLKDASATAIYGSRGANGVILITTKRGKTGEMNVTYEGSFTLKNSLRFFDQLTGDQWMEIARDNQRNAFAYETPYPNPEDDADIVDGMPAYVWDNVRGAYTWNEDGTYVMRPVTADERARWEQVIEDVPDEVPLYNPDGIKTYDWYSDGRNKNALTQNHLLSVSGGSDRLTAYFSIGYIDEHGQGIGERYQRISPRLNLDFQVYDWLKLGLTTTYLSSKSDPGEGLLWGVTNMLPISQPYDEDGTYLLLPTGDIQVKNPLNDEVLNTRLDLVNRYIGAYYAEVSLTKDLKYRLNVSQDYRGWKNGRYRDGESSVRYPDPNEAYFSQGQTNHFALDNLLFYNKEFGIHSIGVTLLQSIETRKMERNSQYAQDLPYPTQLWYALNTTLDPGTVVINDQFRADDDEDGLLYSKYQLASFMGRINYGLLDRYLLTASLRYDGSSKFYKDNQWDYFPSFSVAWKAHNESFLQNVNFLSQLKLRFGYGTVGQSGSPPYETAGRLVETFYVFGDEAAKGYAPDLIQTREVGWEKTTTTNIGIDFGFFRNRLAGTVEVYRANTSDLLLNKTLPYVTGYDQVRANVGKTRNEGLEITINSFNIDKGDFRWETDFTFFTNKEQIVELADGREDDIVNGWFIGEPIDSYYDYVYDGIWQVDEQEWMDRWNATSLKFYTAGQIRVKDMDGNDTINENDKVVVGNTVPKFSGGMTNRFYYKGFELSFFLYWRVGQGIYSRDGHYFPMTARYNTKFLVNYYKPMGTPEENADAEHPAPSNLRDIHEGALHFRESSFLKVRHITLSYDFPQSLISKAKIKSLRLSVQVFNPFLFTDYPYLDPEAYNKRGGDQRLVPGGTSDRGWTFSIKLGL